MTVRRLLGEVDSLELTQWQAYEQVYGPLGGARDDVLAALVSATVANSVPGRKGSPVKAADLMPKWDQHKPAQTWQEQLAAVKQWNAQLGGTVNAKGA